MKILKFLSVVSLLFCWTFNGIAQDADSIIYESATMLVAKNTQTRHFEIKNKRTKETLKNLKFVRWTNQAFQVLDEDKKIFYIDENWKITEEVHNMYGLCGTVPHYTMTVKETKDSLLVYENETFYDHADKIPAARIFGISKKDADRIFFINGLDRFDFTANFNAFGDGLTNPRTIFIYKNGKYFQADNPKEEFDNLDFSNYDFYIKTFRDELYGVLGVTVPKYRNVSSFNDHLAKAVLPDGREIYIDKEGAEYY